MRKISPALTGAALIAVLGIGSAVAQDDTNTDDWIGSRMMMGSTAGCPLGGSGSGMRGRYMMGPNSTMGGTMGGGMHGGMMNGGGMMGGGMMGGDMHGSGRMGGQGYQQDNTVSFDILHDELGIRDAQEDAWSAYIAAADADRDTMYAMHSTMLQFMHSSETTASAWIDAHRSMMQTRADSLDTLATAMESLYAELDDDQKATFDQHGGGMCGNWQ